MLVGVLQAHEHGLVHRDVKPSNLILSIDGRVKVLDLGLARWHASDPARDELTPAGQMMGTLDYLAPEQAGDARSADIRADLYSLGCTLYHFLAGQPPFAGPPYRSRLAKLAAHLGTPAPPVQEQRPEVPAALAALVHQLLAKDPAERPATPQQVADALAPFTAGCNLAGLLVSFRAGPGPGNVEGGQVAIETPPTRAETPPTLPTRVEAALRPRRPWRSRAALAAGGLAFVACVLVGVRL
jgi:serine/threonine protein kinase